MGIIACQIILGLLLGVCPILGVAPGCRGVPGTMIFELALVVLATSSASAALRLVLVRSSVSALLSTSFRLTPLSASPSPSPAQLSSRTPDPLVALHHGCRSPSHAPSRTPIRVRLQSDVNDRCQASLYPLPSQYGSTAVTCVIYSFDVRMSSW